MIPYIVVLVFIIAMILWVVYGQLRDEGFGDSPSTYTPLVVTDKTTVADMIESSKKKVDFFKKVKATLDMPTVVLPKFTPQEIGMETLNIVEQEEDGKKFYRGPTEDSPTLLDAFRVLVKSKYEQAKMQSSPPPPDIDMNQTYKSLVLSGFEKFKPDATEEEKEAAFSGSVDYFNKKEAKEFEIYQRILDANKKVTTSDKGASGNNVTVTTLKKAPVIEINRIYAMVGSSYDNKDKPIKDKEVTDADAPEAELNTTKPKEKKITDSKPDSAPACSDKLSKELEDRLAKNITKQLRDDMLSQRALSDVRPSSAPCIADTMPSTNLTQQGYEYQHSKPLDMNDYIRKDSIPCWGCSLPQ
jgi:hypothetical protein